MNIVFLDTPIGRLAISGQEGLLTGLHFESDPLPARARQEETPLLREAAAQLRAYFGGSLRRFELPLAPGGTPFMLRAWEALRAVPYGETASYGQIAARLGNPGAARAVGLANNRNPIPIIIPCHRVVGANGQLTGYRGGLGAKRLLLELERAGA